MSECCDLVCVARLVLNRAGRIAAALQSVRTMHIDFHSLRYFGSLQSLAAYFGIDFGSIGPSLCPFFTVIPCPSTGCLCLYACICDHCLSNPTGPDDLLLDALIAVRVVAALCIYCCHCLLRCIECMPTCKACGESAPTCRRPDRLHLQGVCSHPAVLLPLSDSLLLRCLTLGVSTWTTWAAKGTSAAHCTALISGK